MIPSLFKVKCVRNFAQLRALNQNIEDTREKILKTQCEISLTDKIIAVDQMEAMEFMSKQKVNGRISNLCC